MPSVSKIPQNINKYVIKEAYKIKNKKVEYGKGFDFELNIIKAKSKWVVGNNKSNNYDFEINPKDLFLHNHPVSFNTAYELSLGDIGTAVLYDVKKIFASHKDGYTSLDMTTVKKNISKKQMFNWVIGRKTIWEIDSLLPKSLEEKKKMHYNDIKKFAKFSGATFSDFKWSDYPQLKSKP